MEYYEVTPASNSTQPDLHKRNHVAQTWCTAAGERNQICSLNVNVHGLTPSWWTIVGLFLSKSLFVT